MPHVRSITSVTSARCRAPRTRFKMTPAMRTSVSNAQHPRTRAPAVRVMRVTSSTRTTGVAVILAISADDVLPSASSPSYRPMAASTTHTSAPADAPRTTARIWSGSMK